MSLPALHALRAAHPHAHITIWARDWVADLYGRESFCNAMLLHDTVRGWQDLRGKARVIRRLRAGRFDLAVLLQNAFEAAALVRLAGIPERIGYDRDGRGWLLTDAVAVPAAGEVPEHERYYYLELLRRAKLIPGYEVGVEASLAGAKDAAAAGRARLSKLGIAGGIVGVSPGAAYGGAKRWLPERFAAAAIRIARERNLTVALFGSAAERPLCDEVGAIIRAAGMRVVNCAGQTTLGEFIELAASASLFLTNDSGAMHVASALGVPTVAVFGATNHITTGPARANARVVREPVECSPCLRRECPIDHRCMKRVSAERVAETALTLLR